MTSRSLLALSVAMPLSTAGVADAKTLPLGHGAAMRDLAPFFIASLVVLGLICFAPALTLHV